MSSLCLVSTSRFSNAAERTSVVHAHGCAYRPSAQLLDELVDVESSGGCCCSVLATGTGILRQHGPQRLYLSVLKQLLLLDICMTWRNSSRSCASSALPSQCWMMRWVSNSSAPCNLLIAVLVKLISGASLTYSTINAELHRAAWQDELWGLAPT